RRHSGGERGLPPPPPDTMPFAAFAERHAIPLMTLQNAIAEDRVPRVPGGPWVDERGRQVRVLLDVGGRHEAYAQFVQGKRDKDGRPRERPCCPHPPPQLGARPEVPTEPDGARRRAADAGEA